VAATQIEVMSYVHTCKYFKELSVRLCRNKCRFLSCTHRIFKTPAHYKTHTYTHSHITKQVKTTIVQDKLCIIACNSKDFKQRSGFHPRIVNVECLVNKVPLIQSYLPVHLSPVQRLILPLQNIHILQFIVYAL
jgi:hypothetical protein